MFCGLKRFLPSAATFSRVASATGIVSVAVAKRNRVAKRIFMEERFHLESSFPCIRIQSNRAEARGQNRREASWRGVEAKPLWRNRGAEAKPRREEHGAELATPGSHASPLPHCATQQHVFKS
ncbi:unnamed protein product [Closterium sp. Yama58-4]|nr:unnamed protein product [Closterium sp. Yama58-4]